MLDSLHHGAFDVGLWHQVLQSMENQGMMANNHVTVFGNGLVNNRFSDIQTNQGFMCFSVEVAHLQTGIVVTLLPMQRGNFSNAV